MVRDLATEIDRRLANMKYSSALKISEWRPINIVDLVYDNEMHQKHKNVEDRLISRVDYWINISRVETKNEFLVNDGKTYTAKRFKRFRKFHTFAGVITKSFESWHESTKKEEKLIEQSAEPSAFSTNNFPQNKSSLTEHSSTIFATHKTKNSRFFFLKKSVNFFTGEGKENKSSNIEIQEPSEQAVNNPPDNEIAIQPNKRSGRSSNSHTRPSIFEIESFKNIRNKSQSSAMINLAGSDCEPDPQSISDSKFNAVPILIPNNLTLDNSFYSHGKIYNSIVERKKTRQMFYNPIHHQAEIGEV